MGSADSESVATWTQRLERGPAFSLALGWGAGQLLESFWRDVFAATRPGATVLEIGCGSGDVSLWAAQAGRGFTVVASDLHANARAVRAHPDILFVGGVRAEALPVASGAVDLVVSNYAIEYAERGPALAELARVLRPGGGAALVLHSADSTISATGRLVLQTCEALAAAGVPDMLSRAAALRPDHLSRRKLLKDVLRQREAIPLPILTFSGLNYFTVAKRLLQGDATARTDLGKVDEAVAMRRAISSQQLGVAMDGPGFSAFCAELARLGLQADGSELTFSYADGARQKAGWIALVTRRAGPPVAR